MLADDDVKTRERHERDGTQPLGVNRLLETNPFDRPAESAKSPAPACHTKFPALRKAFRSAYKAFLEVLTASREAAKTRLATLGLPIDATLPPLSHHAPLSPRRAHPPPVVINALGVAVKLDRPTWPRSVGPPAS